jgi:hypothetical protein
MNIGVKKLVGIAIYSFFVVVYSMLLNRRVNILKGMLVDLVDKIVINLIIFIASILWPISICVDIYIMKKDKQLKK